MFKENKYEGIDARLKELDKKLAGAAKLTSQEMTVVVDEYRNLVELKKLRRESEGLNQKKGLDINTIVSAGASLVGVAMMLNFEKSDIISTKTTSLVNKLFK